MRDLEDFAATVLTTVGVGSANTPSEAGEIMRVRGFGELKSNGLCDRWSASDRRSETQLNVGRGVRLESDNSNDLRADGVYERHRFSRLMLRIKSRISLETLGQIVHADTSRSRTTQ